MLLPKIDVEVGESVHREAMRDLVKYAKDKALELNKECYYTPWWNIYRKYKLNKLIIDHMKKFENL